MRHIWARSCALLLVLTVTAACTSDDDGSDGTDSSDGPATGALEAPSTKNLAKGVRLGDQTDQSLVSVVAHEETVVAVGYDNSANVTRPLIVASADGGQSWQRGEIDPESLPDDLVDSVVEEVVWGDDGFVASGQRSDGTPALWTSSDGLDWQMVETEGDSFTTKDSISALTWSDGEYLAAGINSKRAGKATSRVMLWRSEDGVTWERGDFAEAVRGVRGTPSVADVAVSGDRVLIAGGIEDSAMADQPDRLALWLSTDGGRTFGLEKTPRSLGGGFRAYAQDVAVHDGQFHVAVSGDGLSESLHGDESWDPVVVASGPKGWTTHTDAAMSSLADEHPSAIFRAGNAWVLTTDRSSKSNSDGTVYTGVTYDRTDRVVASSLSGPGDQYISDGVSVGEQAVLVGSTSRSGSTEPMVWRFDGLKLTKVSLPDEVSESDPSVDVSRMVATKDEFIAVGAVADSPVAWSSRDLLDWEARGLSGRSAQITSAHVSDAVVDGKGRVVAVGSRQRGYGSDGLVWTRSRKGDWQMATPAALNIRNEGGYGSVDPSAIGVSGRHLVIATDRYVNGEDEIRPFYSHDGGKTWSSGSGTNTVPLSDTDEYVGATRFSDFRSPKNGSIATSSVVHAKQGWVMGGRLSQAGRGERPVVWLSDSGSTWTAPRHLPMPEGAYAANVATLVVRGDQVLATGWVSRTRSDWAPGWTSWVSDDGGKTWELGTPAAKSEAFVNQVIPTSDGYVALGGAGQAASRDAQAWTSKDGLTWTETDLGTAHQDGPGRQYLDSGVVRDDELHLVVVDVPPEGGGIHSQSVGVPDIK